MENKEQVKKLAGDLAYFYEHTYGGCAQCVLAAIKSSVGHIPDEVFQAATGLAGGISGSGYACGALTGGIMAISSFYGRTFSNFADPERLRFKTFIMGRKLVDRFEEEYGSANCKDIQTKVMGRSFDILKKEEFKAMLAAGGHDDKCTQVCSNAVQWIIEILDEEGLL